MRTIQHSNRVGAKWDKMLINPWSFCHFFFVSLVVPPLFVHALNTILCQFFFLFLFYLFLPLVTGGFFWPPCPSC